MTPTAILKLADACGGIPATADRPLLETGWPYR